MLLFTMDTVESTSMPGRSSSENAAPPTVTPAGTSHVPRPMNAFFLFANERRKQLLEQHPEKSNKEISTILGKLWRLVGEEEKNSYRARAKLIREDLLRKHPD